MKKSQHRHRDRRKRHTAQKRSLWYFDLEVVPGSVYLTNSDIGFTICLPPTPPAMKNLMKRWRSLITADPPAVHPQRTLFDRNKYAEITDTARQLLTVAYGNISDTAVDTDSVSRTQDHEEVTTST